MERSYKCRIYPNKKQIQQIQRTFGCVRFVYNYYNNMHRELYDTKGITMHYYDYCKDLKNLKNQYVWLKEVDSTSLQQCLRDIDRAYDYYFKHKDINIPGFRTKKDYRKTYRCTNYNAKRNHPAIEIQKNHIKLPKLGWVKTRDKRIPSGRILNATVLQERSGKYYAIICCCDIEAQSAPKTSKKIGIDLGIYDFCVTSDGVKTYRYEPNKKLINKIIRLHKELDRKTRYSSNWEKARIKLARAYECLTNQKNDYLQKLSTSLIKENDVICIETLDIKDMIRTPTQAINNKAKAHIRDNILNASWYTFVSQLLYKAEWYGKEVRRVKRTFPSSQICCVCGYRNAKIRDKRIRFWDCPNCNTHHDRDINAAINILNEGIK